MKSSFYADPVLPSRPVPDSYGSPPLTVILRILGALAIGSIALIFIAFLSAASNGNSDANWIVAFAGVATGLFLSGILLIALGELIDHAGRAAHYARLIAATLDRDLVVIRSMLMDIDKATQTSAYQAQRAADVLEGANIER